MNTRQKTVLAAPHPATVLAQWERERTALVRCARALAFSYAGSPRPAESEPEARACWDAMYAAYDALGVIDTRDLPPAAAWAAWA